MSRPRNDEAPDLSKPIEITAGAISRLKCPEGKKQAFLRDTKSPSLKVRVTANGAKSFVFESKLFGETIRTTIGDVSTWELDLARIEANRQKMTVDLGHDPREVRKQQEADKKAKDAAEIANALTMGEVWTKYVEARKRHWGDRTYADHLKMVHRGGVKRKRSPVPTVPGALACFLDMRLVDLTPDVIKEWVERESKERAAQVRLALAYLKAFLRWCGEETAYKSRVDPNAASSKTTRKLAGKPELRHGTLQRAQLATWFKHVKQIPNQVIAVYLQCLLILGPRREELALLKWADINFQWKTINIRDKIEKRRLIPLTPYVEHLLSQLPRKSAWVFPSLKSESGKLEEPSGAHKHACEAAGLILTLHDLRRSFASLCEWLQDPPLPAGIGAQIQGHAAQGARERNYIRRPIELVALHHKRIEKWMLEQAGIDFNPEEPPAPRLQVVGSSS